MIDSLTHGNDLFEILIEGANPYAAGPLTEGEQTRLQEAGLDAAQSEALAIGRVVRGGRGVWVLSASEMVLLGHRYRTSVDRVARADITHAERETGRYGETVRLYTRQGAWAMYAVDATRADRLVQLLARPQAALH